MTAASFGFHVTSRSTNPLLLEGTSSDPSIHLQDLTVVVSTPPPAFNSIKMSSATGKIKVSQSDFDSLNNMSIPNTVTFNGDEPGDGTFHETSFTIGSGLGPMALQSDIKSLLGPDAAAAATGTEDA